MNPENVVLVGVINRKRDLAAALDEHWYRIPVDKAPRGVYADVVAFFLSGKVFKEKSGGIHYYARRTGVELARRLELLPQEAKHKRAHELYHRIQLTPLEAKIPPILNRPRPHRFSFIYTTWDRFQSAVHIRDLYSTADYFVDRVFYALRQSGYKPQRTWEVVPFEDDTVYTTGAQIRVICENGDTVIASTQPDSHADDLIYMNPGAYLENDEATVKATLERIREDVRRRGGPRMVDIPIELY
jgi:hypothetical protein